MDLDEELEGKGKGNPLFLKMKEKVGHNTSLVRTGVGVASKHGL